MNGNIWNWKNSWPLKPIDWMIFFCYFLAFDQIQKTKLFKPENFEWKMKNDKLKIYFIGRSDRSIYRKKCCCLFRLFICFSLVVCLFAIENSTQKKPKTLYILMKKKTNSSVSIDQYIWRNWNKYHRKNKTKIQKMKQNFRFDSICASIHISNEFVRFFFLSSSSSSFSFSAEKTNRINIACAIRIKFLFEYSNVCKQIIIIITGDDNLFFLCLIRIVLFFVHFFCSFCSIFI